MEAALTLTVICAVVLLIGWLYAETIHSLKRRGNKSGDGAAKEPLPPVAKRT